MCIKCGCVLGCRYTDEEGREFDTISTQLENREALSTFVKIDIEGMEWKVLDAMTDEEYSKIALLDLEVHWCLPNQDDHPDVIIRVLKRLRTLFYVSGRLAEGDWLNGVGCLRQPLQTSMMSISYINKAAMFGTVVKEATMPSGKLQGSGRPCVASKNATSSRGNAFGWCTGLIHAHALDLKAITITADDNIGAQYSDKLESMFAIESSTIDNDDGAPTALKSLLAKAEPHSMIVLLDVAGREWDILSALSEVELNAIAHLDITMDFCKTEHSFKEIGSLLRLLPQYFLVQGRTMKARPYAGYGWKRIGCLEGQEPGMEVSYVNKRSGALPASSFTGGEY